MRSQAKAQSRVRDRRRSQAKAQSFVRRGRSERQAKARDRRQRQATEQTNFCGLKSVKSYTTSTTVGAFALVLDSEPSSLIVSNGAIRFLYEFIRIKTEMIAVRNSAIGKVHQTSSVTLSNRVKRKAIGKTKITRRKNAISSGRKSGRS